MADLDLLYRYEVDTSSPVGKGGCGVVWRANDLLLGRPAAIKTISETAFGAVDPKVERSFKVEAVAGARLSAGSNQIVEVIDLGRVGSTLYLAMEWIEPACYGRVDISPLTGRCSIGEARAILLQVCDAVEYAHSKGVVHSDIAPWNIVYDGRSNRYKLADFGLLKLLETSFMEVSGSLLQGGRLAFLPDSARRDATYIGRATDVYALAVTFWQLLVGNAALTRRDDEIPRVIRVRHTQTDAPFECYALLVNFVRNHSSTQTVADLRQALLSIPSR